MRPTAATTGAGSRSVVLLAVGIAAASVVVIVAAVVLLRPSGTEVATGSSTPPTTKAASSTTSTAGASTSTVAPTATAGTPPELLATPADPAVIVDLPTAVGVVQAFWPVHVDGRQRADAATLALVEAGPALASDSVACLGGCSGGYGPMTGMPAVSAPPQSSYPATFAAQVHAPLTGTDDDGRPLRGTDTNLIVFTRDAADRPWLAHLVVAAGGANATIAPSTTANVIAAPPAITGDLDPRTLPDEFAAYFQSYRYEGRAPLDTSFNDNGGPAEEGERVYDAHVRLLQAGISDDADYRSGAAEDGYFEFAADPQNLLVCSTIRWTSVNAAQEPGATFEAEDGMFQAFIPLGRYERIERDAVRQVCFKVKADCSCLTIVGLAGGPYEGRTVPG